MVGDLFYYRLVRNYQLLTYACIALSIENIDSTKVGVFIWVRNSVRIRTRTLGSIPRNYIVLRLLSKLPDPWPKPPSLFLFIQSSGREGSWSKPGHLPGDTQTFCKNFSGCQHGEYSQGMCEVGGWLQSRASLIPFQGRNEVTRWGWRNL